MPDRRRSLRNLLAGSNDIGAAFESFHQLRDVLGLIREVGLHHDRGVTTGVAGAPAYLAAELFQRVTVPLPRFAFDDGERNYVRVRRERLERAVSARIVVDDYLVLAGVILEDPADPPQQDADRRALVVGRYTDIDHKNSEIAGESPVRSFGTRASPEIRGKGAR